MGRLGNGGKDGSEIDVFESSFYHNPTQMATVSIGMATVTPGTATAARLWTPGSTFTTITTFGACSGLRRSTPSFLDGKPIACTNAGGVSQVAEYLRFTVEIRHTEYGPYGQKLGEFINTRENPAEFQIDYVRAYQNTDFIASQKTAEDFKQPLLAKLVQK